VYFREGQGCSAQDGTGAAGEGKDSRSLPYLHILL
jgi:hypothetical protein